MNVSGALGMDWHAGRFIFRLVTRLLCDTSLYYRYKDVSITITRLGQTLTKNNVWEVGHLHCMDRYTQMIAPAGYSGAKGRKTHTYRTWSEYARAASDEGGSECNALKGGAGTRDVEGTVCEWMGRKSSQGNRMGGRHGA